MTVDYPSPDYGPFDESDTNFDREGEPIHTDCECDGEYIDGKLYGRPCNYPPCVMANDLILRSWTPPRRKRAAS